MDKISADFFLIFPSDTQMVGVTFVSGFLVLRLSISQALPMFDNHDGLMIRN